MKQVYVATKTRGFLSNLFSYENDDFEFIYNKSNMYETNSRKKMFVSNLAKSSFADHLGLIQRIKVKESKNDMVFSYNRFLDSKVDYIIYLENPLALVHYSTERPKSYISKLKLKRYFEDPHLKSIICLSKACFETLNNFYDIPKHVCIDQIYPFIPNRDAINEEFITHKSKNENLQCLYISSNFKLKGGKDILCTFDRLKEANVNNIKLKIITRIDDLEKITIDRIQSNSNIELYDFQFSKEELNKIYDDSNILLNPTRQDSFSLVALEAMKARIVILSTDLYALPEMVEDNINGYLVEPKYRFFEKNNMPNEYVWNNRKETIYSDYIDETVIDFLYEKIIYLNENRNMLEKMALASFMKSTKGEFGGENIINKWKNVF